MKPFNSSVLAIKESSSRQLLETVQERKSPLIRLLEFDETVARVDLNSTRDYYLSLLKLAQNANIKNSDNVCKAIFHQYDAIVSIINGLYLADDYYIQDNAYNALHDFEKRTTSKINTMDGMITIYTSNSKVPKSCSDEMIEYPLAMYVQKVQKAIESKDLSSIKGYNTLGRDFCNHLGKAICNVDDIESIDDFIDIYRESFELEESEVYIKNAFQMTRDALDRITSTRIPRGCGLYNNGVDALIKTLKINSDIFEDPNDLRMIIQNICDAITASGVIATVGGMIKNEMVTKIKDRNISAIMHAIEEDTDSFSESLSMFGDGDIDSSNIFNLLDGDDFNHSYYMDLSLVADHEMAMTKIRAHKDTLIKEALMITEGNIDQAILEAGIGASIRDGFKKIMDFLKSMMSKFVESIMFNFNTEKAWLTKYRNIIINNGFDPGSEVTFYCNYENALNQIQKIVPPAISYNELRQKPEDFADENTFFQNRFGAQFPNMDAALKDINMDANETLANKCKWYLGAKLPDGVTRTTTFGQLKISQMYQWLLDTQKLAKATEDQLKAIEKTVENYIQQANRMANNNTQNTQQQGAQQSTQQTAQSGQTSQNASFQFGYRVGELITEADVTPKDNGDNGAATPGAADSTPASNNTDPKANDFKQSSGKAKEEIQNSGDEASLVAGRMEIYLKVCKAVLSAKATAITYAHKEMLDVMRAIVKGKLGNSADIKLRNQNPEGATNNTQQQQTQQSAPSNPKPANNSGGNGRGNQKT